MNNRIVFISVLIILAALSRLLNHPLNFTPIAAMGLFSGVLFRNTLMAYLAPLAAMLLSDFFLGFHGLAPIVYGCMAFSTWIGTRIKPSVLSVTASSLVGSVFFFVITNLAVWGMQMYEPKPFYTMDIAGLTECFALAVPFFKNSVAGDLFYNGLLFGSWYLAQKAIPSLHKAS